MVFFAISAEARICENLAAEYRKAQTNLQDGERILSLQGIHNDILGLRAIPEGHQGKPRSFWQNCMDNKIKTLNMHIQLASPRLRENADFHVLLSSSFEMRGELGRAYFHALEGTKLLPKDHKLRLKTFTLWLKTQDTILNLEQESAEKGSRLGLGDKRDFDRQMEFFITPILKDRKAVQDQIAAYTVRAAYYESLARIVDAASDWERLTQLDPRNVVPYKKLAAFELSRGRRTQAQSILEKVIQIAPSDLGASKKLIEIYVERREMQKASRLLSRALSFYPKDADLISFQKLF
jgi:tetratricopeptide (TPR) repeat protein